MNVLIIGGNRFIGKRLAQSFHLNGDKVTLLNRGNQDDGLGSKIERLVANRLYQEELTKVLKNRKWDIVYDHVCYTASAAKLACELFKDKTERYIVISSQSVYDDRPNLLEKDFNAHTYSFEKEVDPFHDMSFYQEAKRQMESVFAREKSLSSSVIRFPYIFGDDDYSGRFHFHIKKILNSEEIFFTNKKAELSFISSKAAAHALFQLSLINHNGPINLASPDPITLENFVLEIGEALGKVPLFAKEKTDLNASPIDTDLSSYLNTTLAKSLGIIIQSNSEWIQEEVKF